jgi:hypothetical protein
LRHASLNTNYDELPADWLECTGFVRLDEASDTLSVELEGTVRTRSHTVDIKRAEIDYPHLRQALRAASRDWGGEKLAYNLARWAQQIAAKKETPQVFFASKIQRPSIFSHPDGAWVRQLVKVELSNIDVWLHWESRNLFEPDEMYGDHNYRNAVLHEDMEVNFPGLVQSLKNISDIGVAGEDLAQAFRFIVQPTLRVETETLPVMD